MFRPTAALPVAVVFLPLRFSPRLLLVLSFFSGRCRLVGALWLLVVSLGAVRPAAGAPDPALDTLRARLARPGLADTLRVRYLTELSAQISSTDLPAAHRAAAQALALARRRSYQTGVASAGNALAAIDYYTGDYPAAQRGFETALTAARRARLWGQAGNAWLGLGNVAQALNDMPRALKCFEQARAAYARMADREAAISGQLLVLNNSANTWLELRQPGKAGRAYRQALALADPAPLGPHAPLIIHLLSDLAALQNEAGYLDSARANLEKGLALAHRTHDLTGEANIHLELAENALQRRQPALARAYATHAHALARQIGARPNEERALLVLSAALRALRRSEAYDTLRAYLTLHDTLLAQDRTTAIIDAQTRFDLAGQQARIQGLEQQRRIAVLEADQRDLENRWLVGWLVTLGVLMTVGLSWAYRRRQARRENQLRVRLAADLHDDVGSLLSQIALQSDLLQEGLMPAEQQPAQWAEVAGSSRMAIRQLNDVVWNLDAHNDTVPDLLNRLRDYAHELLIPTGRDVRFRADNTLPAIGLPAAVRRNLYLIYKEALHNVLKHAPAGCCVTVELHAANEQLVLTVANDAPSGGSGPFRASGHGLRNMRERALAVGGMATVGPRPEGGFAVRVSVPLKQS